MRKIIQIEQARWSNQNFPLNSHMETPIFLARVIQKII